MAAGTARLATGPELIDNRQQYRLRGTHFANLLRKKLFNAGRWRLHGRCMLKSMTAFARVESQHDFGTLVFEIKSVNHRYLEVGLRLPEECRALEPKIRAALAARLVRGKVDVGLRLVAAEASAAELAVDDVLVTRLAAAASRVGETWTGALSPVSALDIMRWPGVVSEPARDLAPLHAATLALLEQGLTELIAGREREGGRLAQMIEERCAGVLQQVAAIRARLPEVRTALLARLRDKVAALEIDVDDVRLEQEVALLAQKADVAEELDRLASHVSEAREALGATEAVGRRLDFLLQEFNREANTLASKSQDSACTRSAVELKVLIEQMREQVQNVE